jgi:hypothetical protein
MGSPGHPGARLSDAVGRPHNGASRGERGAERPEEGGRAGRAVRVPVPARGPHPAGQRTLRQGTAALRMEGIGLQKKFPLKAKKT